MMPPHVLFGTLREHYLLLFGVAGTIALGMGCIGAWIGARFGSRAGSHRSVAESIRGLATQSELRVVTEQLDALLLEVERITEGQRFVAKLLAERVDKHALPPGAPPTRRESGQITPH
ncbi:MAG TPA: hypothetical protein VH277_02900 [Gemmatimonadaceae bacterium]|jgi:hypothetical protein|nr:hypothetical protein [Gemmatimonadaceae bacterium]